MNNEQGKSAVGELREALTECLHRCNHCFTGCLMEDDVKMMAECIRLDRDCIEACAMALKFLYKRSRFQREVLMLCKNICIVCGEECARFPQMGHCQRSAEACREAVEKIDAFIADLTRKDEARGSANNGVSC
ncbi:MAG: four-helix bundle copper-binding protein [Alistipes sp.]|nr:four-helix bundle copper-binding protein [Alistipes sp.]